jgi:hypothetical protein
MVKQYRHLMDEWKTRLVLGHLGDITHLHKFGRNNAVGAAEEDMWLVGGKETLLTAPASMYVSCEDNINGIGQTIQVNGLDENWEQKTETVVTNGHTQEIIGAANSWTRIFRAFQISAEPDPVGDLWIAESDTLTLGVPNTASKIHGKIEYTNAAQQTQKAMVTVPAGHIALVYSWVGSMLNASGGAARDATFALEAQELATGATVASPSWAPWRRVDEQALSTSGDTGFGQSFEFPLVFEELTNFHLRATATASSILSGDFDVVFVRR